MVLVFLFCIVIVIAYSIIYFNKTKDIDDNYYH